jgi:toxin ParE1/3/4
LKPIIIHHKARAELDAAIAYYEQQQAGLGLALQSAIAHAIESIQQHPQIGPPHKTTECRYYVVQRFPYIVFYTELEEVIWVVAIAHGKRRPDYWRRRRIG